MATSKTSLCNRALGRIGESSQITDFTADLAAGMKGAIECERVFEGALKEVARSGAWNCLKKRTELTSYYTTAYDLWIAEHPGDTTGAITAGEAASPAFGWSRSYPLPDDCVRLVQLNGVAIYNDGPDDYFEIEGRTLMTDAEEAKIQYIAVETSWGPFPVLVPHETIVTLADLTTVPLFGAEVLAVWAEILQHPDYGGVLISNGGTPVTTRELALPPSGGETLHDLAEINVQADVAGAKLVVRWEDYAPVTNEADFYGRFDALLCDCIVVLLASMIAEPMRADSALGQSLRQEYERVTLPRGRQNNGNERHRALQSPAQTSAWVGARCNSTRG